MPSCQSRARLLDIHTASVIVRTRMSVLPSCVLKRIQKPLNSVRNQKPGQILLQVLGLIRAGGEALQVGAVRDDRGRQVDVQEHPQEAEQAPDPDLIGVHVAQPLAPAHRFSGVAEKGGGTLAFKPGTDVARAVSQLADCRCITQGGRDAAVA